MSYLFFSLDVILQSLCLSCSGILIAIILQKQKNSHRCYFVSKGLVMASLSCSICIGLVVLCAAFMNPTLMHPLKTPFDLIQVAESLNPITKWCSVFTLIVVALGSGLYQLIFFLSAREDERNAMKTKLKRLSGSKAYATRMNTKAKKFKKELSSLEAGYAFIMSSEDVPQHVKDEYFKRCNK
uniref:Uncharacterized protein n=1 Tax=uncultured prokaryote TaxID=198431 RepID=A0A0H5PZ26_9ZZZZ|nr:hypothetical protein [uncultured prokaryote]